MINKKYIYESWDENFLNLFMQEEKRIKQVIKEVDFSIDHIGSTAVKGCCGKGIIDILIGSKKENFPQIGQDLEKLKYKKNDCFSTERRWFFKRLGDSRWFHVHLVDNECREFKELIGFRDYLLKHPEAVNEYNKIKQSAVQIADQDGKKYRELKEPFILNILSKCL